MVQHQTLYRALTIGKHRFEGNLILAPMAGYTDQAFREIALEQGAAFAYTEMSSCEALWRNEGAKTAAIMQPYHNEATLAIQIFSGNVQAVEASMPKVLAFKPSIIDLNVGCPVQKVNKSGAGSALMQNPSELKAILRCMRSAMPKEMAMTVKFRSGWTQESRNYLEIAQLALECGADMITLHPRTRSQGYSGKADWSQLQTLKATFPSAVVCASGDLFSPEDIAQVLESTGVDAVMVARGSVGNPFIFRQTKALLLHGSYNEVDELEKMQLAYRHFRLSLAYRGDGYTINEMKKHLAQYAKGSPLLAKYRKLLVLAQTVPEMEVLFAELFKEMAMS